MIKYLLIATLSVAACTSPSIDCHDMVKRLQASGMEVINQCD